MKQNLFKFLRKKILQYSSIEEKFDGDFIIYRIKCLGFNKEIVLPKEFSKIKTQTGILIDELVQEPGFLEKLEQIERRNQNIKILLD